MKKKLTAIILFLITSVGAFAQTNLTFYNFGSVAESNLLNPGILPQQKFTLGVTDIYQHVYVPGMSYYDIYRKDQTASQTILNILNNDKYHLKNIQFNSEVNPIFIGFRVNKNYFSLGVQNVVDVNLGMPKQALQLAWYGNGSSQLFGKDVSFNDVKAQALAYTAIHFGFAREVNSKWSFGIRGKYLIGLGAAELSRNNSYFRTDSGTNNAIRITAASDYELKAAGYDHYKAIGDTSGSQQTTLLTQTFTKPVGSGFSVDFGGKYKANKRLSISFSVLNLGAISWKQSKTYSQNAKFVYEGILTDDPNKLDSALNHLKDSVSDIFKPVEKTTTYSTSLAPKIYIGLDYQLYNSGRVGFVAYGEYWNKSIQPGLAISFTQRIWKILDLRANYNMFRDQYTNVGAGFALNLGFIQMYAMTDNALAFVNYETAHYTNVRAGLNFTIGNRYDRDNDGVPDKKDKCKRTYGPSIYKGCPDSDGDSIPDYLDKCVWVAGSASAKGCPDADRDSVQDKNDSCVTVAGLAYLHGCPDADGDSIPDNMDKCPDLKGPVSQQGCPDADGDGVIDPQDACPNEFGTAATNGCPDADGDGIADKQDQCPNNFGLAKNGGCPDTDNDGIIDSKDSCVNEAGPAYTFGCPDADKDGIPDKVDACPAEAGSEANHGCPDLDPSLVQLTVEEKKVLNEAFSNLEFETGTAKITDKSFASLTELSGLLATKTAYKLDIAGYTDNVGNPTANKKLSQNRADAVKKFLMNNGIDASRMKATGFGAKNPVASNATAEGRQRNRRVEFKIVK